MQNPHTVSKYLSPNKCLELLLLINRFLKTLSTSSIHRYYFSQYLSFFTCFFIPLDPKLINPEKDRRQNMHPNLLRTPSWKFPGLKDKSKSKN